MHSMCSNAATRDSCSSPIYASSQNARDKGRPLDTAVSLATRQPRWKSLCIHFHPAGKQETHTVIKCDSLGQKGQVLLTQLLARGWYLTGHSSRCLRGCWCLLGLLGCLLLLLLLLLSLLALCWRLLGEGDRQNGLGTQGGGDTQHRGDPAADCVAGDGPATLDEAG